MKTRLLYILSIIGILISLLIYKCRADYYAEYDAVKSELMKIPGIRITEIYGNPDITLEDIYATIELPSGSQLGFFNLRPESFENAPRISLYMLNNWHFNEVGCDSPTAGPWANNSLNIGYESEYPELRNLELKSIKDVVERFGDLAEIIEKIASYPAFDTLRVNYRSAYLQKYDFTKIPDSTVKWPVCK